MIAPIKNAEAPASSPSMRRARRLAASALLKQRSHPADSAPSIPAWQAWLFTAWVVTVTAVYFAYMARLL